MIGFNRDTSDFYERVTVGDSLFKPKKTSTISIYREGEFIDIVDVYFH